MFDIVTIKRKTYALITLENNESKIILLRLKTKEQYIHYLVKKRNRFYLGNIQSRYIKDSFFYVQKIIKKRYRKNISNKLCFITSKKKIKKIKLPQQRYNLCLLQVFKKSHFIFSLNQILFSLSLKTKKTKVTDFCITDDYSWFTFSEKLKRYYRFDEICNFTIINFNSCKNISKKTLMVPRRWGRCSYFSKDNRFLILRESGTKYHMFSILEEFKLMKIFRCNFESLFLIFGNRNIYFRDFANKQVAFINMLSSGLSCKKKTTDIDKYRKKNNNLTNLGKRTNSNFENNAGSVDSKVEKPIIIFDEKKPTKKEKKKKHLCTKSMV